MEQTEIPDKMFFRIGDVAEIVGVKPYVLRYWETEFQFLSPDKSHSGQRVYRKSDVETLLLIKHLLYKERYSIEGARNRIRELRKEGELDSFKKEKVIPPSTVDRDRIKALLDEATALRDLVKSPPHNIFRL